MEIKLARTETEARQAHGLLLEMCAAMDYEQRPEENAYVNEILAQPDNLALLIAESGGKLIGIATVGCCFSSYIPGWFGFLMSMYVLPEERRSGVAKQLFAAAREEARKRDWKGLFWRVHKANKASLGFFAKEGGMNEGDPYIDFWLSEEELV